MLFKLTEKDGLFEKIRNHVGTTVEHPVSQVTRDIRSRLSDEGVKKTVSVCPYCAVGCSTLVYHRDGRIIDIEGNPDSPINAGTLCPKGSGGSACTSRPTAGRRSATAGRTRPSGRTSPSKRRST